MGIIVEGCLADFRANGCLGERMCRLAVNVMAADAAKYPMLPEALRGMDAEDLGHEFILAMYEKDLAKDPGGDSTSWDKVLLKDGATDEDMASYTRVMANHWLIDQFKTTQMGKDHEKLRKKLSRARKGDGLRMFAHYRDPSAWGLAGGPDAPTCVARRELESAARRHAVTRLESKGGRDGNLGRAGEVEALAGDVLAIARGTVEQSLLFSLIMDRVTGAVVVNGVVPVTDWAGGRVDAFGMEATLDRASMEHDGHRLRVGGLKEV